MAAPRVTIDQLPEQMAATGTDLFVVQNGATTKKMTVSKVLDVSATDLNAHVTNPTGAHAATAITAAPNASPLLGVDVQTQLSQAASAINTNTTAIGTNSTTLSNHLGATSDAHDASMISLASVGGMSALDVQAAVAELKTSSIPPGGAAGQVLTKGTTADFDAGWNDLIAGPAGPQGPQGATGDWSSAQVIDTVSTATYAVVAADAGKLKRHTAACTVTLPSGELAAGQRVDFVCQAGIVTFALGSGATWDVAPTPSPVGRSVGSMMTAIKMGATTWALTGDLA